MQLWSNGPALRESKYAAGCNGKELGQAGDGDVTPVTNHPFAGGPEETMCTVLDQGNTLPVAESPDCGKILGNAEKNAERWQP